MTTIRDKARHVREAEQDRQHSCHWPDCKRQVPPARFMCKKHWFRLPLKIRTRIWRTYRPGQEIDLQPSPEYVEAAKAAQTWIRENAA